MQSNIDDIYIKPFPFFDSSTEDKPIPKLAREYAFDFETKQFKRDTENRMYIVEGNEALKVWIWRVFMTNRYQYNVFPDEMGQELDTLVGQAYTQGYINSEARRFYTEALERNLSEYIESIENMEVIFDDGLLTISAYLKSIYGNLNIDNLKVWGW